MENTPTPIPRPKGSDGGRLQVSPGDADSLPEVRNAGDAGGGGHVRDEVLNDPDLQAVVWPPKNQT